MGALRCLVDGGDVAFVKHTTPDDFIADGNAFDKVGGRVALRSSLWVCCLPAPSSALAVVSVCLPCHLLPLTCTPLQQAHQKLSSTGGADTNHTSTCGLHPRSLQADYRIMDRAGCHPIDEYVSHNLGEAPAKTIVARADWTGLDGVADAVAYMATNVSFFTDGGSRSLLAA